MFQELVKLDKDGKIFDGVKKSTDWISLKFSNVGKVMQHYYYIMRKHCNSDMT
jgi:hypothetical protein